MNPLILSLLIEVYCQNWMASEHMKPQTYEEGYEYYNCINQADEKEIFDMDNHKKGLN
jgi:hypothetical protein